MDFRNEMKYMEQNIIKLKKTELFQIREGNRIFNGPDQSWYPKRFQRMAGCGPTACSNIMWYLSQTKEKYKGLCTYDGITYEGFLKLMEDVWKYVTPGLMGVNKLEIFEKGAISYGKDKGYDLSCKSLRIPSKNLISDAGIEEAFDFIEEALVEDLPVAFLNLSNGQLSNLESWHWVTIYDLDREKGSVSILDQSRLEEIDLRLWLKTTSKGGGFVVVS
ncbi:hypothetical protein [Anaerosporobacter sp.]